MKCFLVAVVSVGLLGSCATKRPVQAAVDLRSTVQRVDVVGTQNVAARAYLASARDELDALDALALGGSYAGRIELLQRLIADTDKVLEAQSAELDLTKRDLALAQEAAQASAEEKAFYRDEADKWRGKYLSGTKYRWIVFGRVAWIVVKFFVRMGAWTPQGRFFKFLVG
jgi:hypothetical protein